MSYLKISIGIFIALAVSRFVPHPPNFTSLLALSFYVPAILGTGFLFITEKDMTRFWITINQGIELVNHAFNDMKGGEIYVPKIPSIKITDLAKAMGPKLKQKIISIRLGEKIHESLTSKDESSNVLMFKKCYVITPNYSLANLKK